MVLSIALLATLSLSTPVSPPVIVDEIIIQRLVESLSDPDPDIRHNLAVSLAKIGPAAVEPLIRSLSDSSAVKRAGAAYSLALIGSSARAAMPALLDCLKDQDLSVRRQASYAIARILPTNPRRNPSAGEVNLQTTTGDKP